MLIQLLSNNPSLIRDYQSQVSVVMLLQDGVYCADILLKEFADNCRLVALEDDWLARGLPHNDKLDLVSYQQWVELATVNTPVLTLQ